MTIPQPFLPATQTRSSETGLTMWRNGTGAAFAIVHAGTDQLLGAVTRFGPEGHQATFGLWLGPDARGRGVGTRALRLVSDWTFATTAAIRLDAFIMVGNEASNRMTERAGFQREGVAPRVGPPSRRRARSTAWSTRASAATPERSDERRWTGATADTATGHQVMWSP